MGATLTTINSILKTRYNAPVREWLNNRTYFLQKIRKQTEGFSGLQAYIPYHYGRNIGIGPRGENSALPIAGNQAYGSLTYKCRYLYGSLRLTGQSIAMSRDNAGAFAQTLQSEMQGLIKDIARDESRQIFHDGSGVLTDAVSASFSTDTTVTVKSTKYLAAGMVCGMAVKSTGASETTNADSFTIATVPSSTTFTVAGVDCSTSIDTSTVVYRIGTRGTWASASEMWGLDGIMQTTNPGAANGLSTASEAGLLGALTRTNNTDWQVSTVLNGGTNRDWTPDLMQQAWDTVDLQIGTTPKMAITNHAILRRIAAYFQSDRRYVGAGLQTFDGGFKGLEYNGVPIMADYDANKTNDPTSLNSIYLLDLDAFILFVAKDWGWMDEDGNILKQAVSSGTTYSYSGPMDAYDAFYSSYRQLGIDNAKGLCRLGDLKES